MMKTIMMFMIPLFLMLNNESCTNKEKATATEDQSVTEQSGIDDCISQKIEDFKAKSENLNYSRIYSFTSNGEKVYMFDEGMIVDGAAYVLSENCDTLCLSGGMRMVEPEKRDCPTEDENSRVMIWEKNPQQ